jgi:hypothetical protein
MKNKFLLLVIAVMVIISSCKQNAPQLAIYIPKDAAFVLEVDVNTIKEK